MLNATQTREQVSFTSVDDFKQQLGATVLDIVRNPKTNKLFMTTGSQNFRVQADINLALPLRILIPEAGIADACLINSTGGAEVLGSL